MQVDKFRKLGFDIDNRVEIRENDRFGKHICAFKTIEKGDSENQKKNSAWVWIKWTCPIQNKLRWHYCKNSIFTVDYIVKLSEWSHNQYCLRSVSMKITLTIQLRMNHLNDLHFSRMKIWSDLEWRFEDRIDIWNHYEIYEL